MMRTYTYPAVLEPGAAPGVVVVIFPDVGEALTQGDGEADALEMASDALGVALLGLLAEGQPLPKASKARAGQRYVTVDVEVAGKLAVIEAFRDAGITQAELAARLGKDGREARRILDPDCATKLPTLAAALNALGRRLVVGVEDAA